MDTELWKEAERFAKELGLHDLVQGKIDPDDEFYREHPDYAYISTLLNEIFKKYGSLDNFQEFLNRFLGSDLPNLAVADVIFHEPELARQVEECFRGWTIVMEDGKLTEEGKSFFGNEEAVH